MRFAQRHPDFAAIEQHVRAARVERSLYLAEAIASGFAALGGLFSRADEAERERRHIAAEPFLRRSIQ